MTVMEDLTPRARGLVDAGRGAFRASAGDRARIEAALRVRLGTDVLPPEVSIPRLVRAAGRRTAARLALGAGVAVVVGAALLGLQAHRGAPVRPTARSVQPPAAAPARPATHVADAAEADGAAPARAAAGPRQGPAPNVATSREPAFSPPDRLAQEVMLLSRATAELRTGHVAKALKALDEHQRKFPNGLLSEDRRTAKAQALCLLGQLTKGRAELALLPPQSPGAARAKQVCDGDSVTTHPP